MATTKFSRLGVNAPAQGKGQNCQGRNGVCASKLTSDLLPDFRDRVDAFLSVLKNAGARVSIGDTAFAYR